MSLLPRVTALTRERVSLDFDTHGPDVCTTEIFGQLERENPELLKMASKCAADSGDPSRLMVGFGMFYRLLAQESRNSGIAIPYVEPETRDLLVSEIDEMGIESFTSTAISELETANPELLQMAHHFASHFENYLHAMQGFALLYRALAIQSMQRRGRLH